MPNRDRLIALTEWVGAQQARLDAGLPSEWDQGAWFVWNGEPQDTSGCGTACCMAGRVTSEDGGIPLFETWVDNATELHRSATPQHAGVKARFAQMPDGEVVDVGGYARKELGLNDVEAAVLFDADNTYDEATRALRALLADDEDTIVEMYETLLDSGRL